MDVLFQGRKQGSFVQTAFPLTQEFEVEVRFENRDVFGPKQRKTRMLSEACSAWLDQYGGDWGMINWEIPNYDKLDSPYMEYIRVGRIFQFGDRRTAQLFLLTWNCFKVPQRRVEEAS